MHWLWKDIERQEKAFDPIDTGAKVYVVPPDALDDCHNLRRQESTTAF